MNNTTRAEAGFGGNTLAAVLREDLDAADAALSRAYHAGTRVEKLLQMRADVVDNLLRRTWREVVAELDGVALVAVGGYGRGELLPYSDIDLLVLVADPAPDTDQIEAFLTTLWDASLNLGHSVRNPAECIRQARQDLTVATALMETRLITGDAQLYDTFYQGQHEADVWPVREFFEAKLAEQAERHAKYHDTGYKLEPNVKESPGGLRDIQTLLWVAGRSLGTRNLGGLAKLGLLTEAEFRMLRQGQQFLWKVRYLLHIGTGRCEDRLLFDLQRDLAHAFGYLDDTRNMAVEHFMQRYYRTVMRIQRLNEVLLQSLKENVLHDDSEPPQRLTEHFVVRKGLLDVARADVFKETPTAMLQAFLLLAEHPEIEDIGATTIRLMRAHLHLINDDFRNSASACELFLAIMRAPRGITHNLRRMNRYGLLAAYLPVFERIVGRMQYDLFHVYTVDEHSLFVVRNLRRLTMAKHRDELPHCYEVSADIPKLEVLYVAGLFHDIAKGRGGDHSELGAVDAAEFCRRHDMDAHDSRLVEWLVRHHLLMSVTAQRKDLGDPDVIHAFASQVLAIDSLNHLYLLTVADIRATNPELWNSYKDSLLRELYLKTYSALQRGLDNPVNAEDRIADTKRRALELLQSGGITPQAVNNIWQDFGDGYFLRHNADEVAWHTQIILSQHTVGEPLVAVRQETTRGSTEVFVFVADHDHLFALVTAVLDRVATDIVDARIVTSESGWALDTFLILERDGEVISDARRVAEIREALLEALRHPDVLPNVVTRRVPSKLQHFNVPLEVRRTDEQRSDLTPIEIIAPDSPGLLAKIGRSFVKCDLQVHSARIVTVGERAHDVFFVTDRQGLPLDDESQLTELRNAIDAELQG